jgi:hypothetical protein
VLPLVTRVPLRVAQQVDVRVLNLLVCGQAGRQASRQAGRGGRQAGREGWQRRILSACMLLMYKHINLLI